METFTGTLQSVKRGMMEMELMYKLRIWLAYHIMPKDTREYLLKALSDNIKELEREVTELYDEMNAKSQ